MGDFSANFQRPETGIHTVEGNVAGSRAALLAKQREAQQKSFEQKKLQIQSEASKARQRIDSKFNTDSSLSHAEKTFRDKTIGLVTAEEFKKAAQESYNQEKKRNFLPLEDEEYINHELDSLKDRLEKQKKKAERLKRKKMMSTLSFANNDDEDQVDEELPSTNEKSVKKESMMKDPTIDTSFLPDRKREAYLEAERKRLKQEWITQQEALKKQMLEIVYSYWDGSGHRRTVTCHKGDSISQFLELVRKDLSKEFREMQNVSSEALLYIKEDLIIPQDITFYDLIITKARGKSGPLFHFDVHDDVRIGAIDSRIEKDESHPGKVVERRWYERNKHIFPASRWEVWDASKDYGRYTIHGQEITKESKDSKLRERLQCNFSKEKSEGTNNGDLSDDDDGEGGGVLRQRKKLIMLQYIEQHLECSSKLAPEADSALPIDSNVKDTSSFDPLYQREADVGVGGTVLGGTGIAEVTLPVDYRLQSVQETEKILLSKQERVHQHNSYDQLQSENEIRKLLPTSFGDGVTKKKRMDDDCREMIQKNSTADIDPKRLISSLLHKGNHLPNKTQFSASSAGVDVRHDDVSNLGRSYAHDFQLHNQEWIQNKREFQQREVDTQKKNAEISSSEAVGERVGFDNLKKYGEGRSNFHSQIDRSKFKSSNDDRLWKNFVTRTRDSRK